MHEITTLSCGQVDAGFNPQAPPGPKQTQLTESGQQGGSEGRILGGSDAAAGEFPAHVSLHVGVSVLQQFICSGSIKYPPWSTIEATCHWRPPSASVHLLRHTHLSHMGSHSSPLLPGHPYYPKSLHNPPTSTTIIPLSTSLA